MMISNEDNVNKYYQQRKERWLKIVENELLEMEGIKLEIILMRAFNLKDFNHLDDLFEVACFHMKIFNPAYFELNSFKIKLSKLLETFKLYFHALLENF